MTRRSRPRSRWRRHRRNRRLAVLLLVLVGCAAAVADLQGSPEPTGTSAAYVVREIRSGAQIVAADVADTVIPSDSPLSGAAMGTADVVGRTAIGDLLPGELVTPTRIVEGRARQGTATMPVVFDDLELGAFLTPGTRIDVLWTPGELSEGESQVVAADARVLQVGGGGARDVPGSGILVLLEVAEADTVALADAMGSGSLSVLLR